MSTAPSSIPPPSFDVAPELPEGVERPPRPESPRWKPWMAWAALVAAFGGALIGALVIGVIGSAAGSSFADPSPAVSISATIVQDLSFIGAALLFASISGRPLPEQFGLRPTRFWPAVGWMAVAFAAFYVFTLVWVAILGVSPDDTKLPDELGVKDSTYALLAVAFLVAVVAPMAEEFFFRGFFFGALRNWKGPWPAAVITGLVFGAIHVGSAEAAFLLPLAFFGFCALPAARAHRIAVSGHRPALHEQLAGLRRLPALGLGDPRALRVRAGAHLARRAHGARAVDAGAGARRLSARTANLLVGLPA